MSAEWPSKDPNEVLDYVINWTARLGSDTITSSSFTVDSESGLVKDSNTNTTTSTTIWLSGGTAGKIGTITNTVITLGGRTMEEAVQLPIRNKS